MRRALLAFLVLIVGSPAGAGTLSFDEIPPANNNWAPLGEEYAHMGVHFLTTDDGAVWSGISDGDPGGWELEGTNGSAFVGFNGRSYGLTMLLDEAVDGFQLDVARSAGSSPGAGFTLAGFRNGEFVEEAFVDLGANGVNEWSTAALSQPVDEVQWIGSGGREPFGVDNVQWGGEGGAGTTQVEIDVGPGNSDVVNPFSRGVVPITIFGSDAFHVKDVDPETLALGPEGAPPFGGRAVRMADVDGDGYDDLFCHHLVRDTGIALGDEEACVTGETFDGVGFEGCAPVVTVPHENGNGH